MYCPSCGEELEENSRYCRNCGTEIESDEPTESNSPKTERADQNESGWGANQSRQQGERQLKSFKANHTQSEGRAVGGKLFLTDQRLLFEPDGLDSKNGGELVSIDISNIERVTEESRGGGSLRDTVFDGGLRKRLRIDTALLLGFNSVR